MARRVASGSDSDGTVSRHVDVLRRLATFLVVAAMFWPLVSNVDGLPLSSYPMYSGTRSETLSFITASGVAEDGGPIQLSTPQIAQTRDPLIAQSFLNDAIAGGAPGLVCQEIAARMRGSQVVTVEIARETHNVIAFVRSAESLVERTPIVTCEVAA